MRFLGDRVVVSIFALAMAAVVGSGALNASGNRPGAQAAGGKSPGGDALRVVRAAAKATLAGTAQVEYRLLGAQIFGSSSAPVLGSGRLDFRSATGTETIDLGETGNQEPGNESVVFGPARVYLQPKSAATAVLPKGKTWMAATLAGSESVNTNFPSFALQVEGVIPQLLVEQLAHGAVSAAVADTQTIEGRRAHGYDVSIDLSETQKRLTGSAGRFLGQAIQTVLAAAGAVRSPGGGETTIGVWIDGAGHVVRMRAAPPGAGVGTATMTMCCFGSPVRVAAPAASQVIDITSLTPSGERENNGGGDSDGG
jgi:hypothetical protein